MMLLSKLRTLLSIGGAFLIATSTAQLQFTSSGCADPAGFDSCWSNATSIANTCYKNNCQGGGECIDENDCSSSDPNCVSSCICGAYVGWINCALSHCWNHVYSCKYQNLLVSALENCPIAGVSINLPYFPAPRGAPSSCSCDLSYVYTAFRQSIDYVTKCKSGQGSTPKTGFECGCCAASEGISAFYNVCPDTDPTVVPFYKRFFPQAIGVLDSNDCQTYLTNNPSLNCSDLGYFNPGLPGAPFLNSGDIPANGTQTLSDGSKVAITSPLGGPMFTWTFAGDQVFVATAASAGGGGSAAPTSAGSSAGGGGGAAPTSSGSSTASTSGGSVASSTSVNEIPASSAAGGSPAGSEPISSSSPTPSAKNDAGMQKSKEIQVGLLMAFAIAAFLLL